MNECADVEHEQVSLDDPQSAMCFVDEIVIIVN